MSLKPNMTNPPGDIELTDGLSKSGGWILRLDGGPQAINISSLTDDNLAIYLRSVGKKIGDFDEQRTWRGGRGHEYLTNDPTSYFDAKNCWTLSDNQLIPSPQWKFSTGYRKTDMDMPGSVSWKALIGSTKYIETSFDASASYDADYGLLWIRRRGNPGTLTIELCSDSAGNPNTVLQTVTKTTADITDVISVLQLFDWTSTQALASATTYHIKIYGAATDSSRSHWEVGAKSGSSTSQISSDGSTWTPVTYSLYFRIADADIDRRWFLFHYGTKFCAVDKKVTGNSELYSWNETTDAWELVSTPGLTTVFSCPVVCNNIVYFPQGESVNIRRWNGTTFADDGTNKASFLCVGYDTANGPQLYRANTAAGTTSNISRGTVAAWSTDIVFGNDIKIGEFTYPITSLLWANNQLYVYKEDGMFIVSNDRVREEDFGIKATPSPNNGAASCFHNQFIYMSWLHSTERVFGITIDDVGQGWRGPALPAGREAIDARYEPYVGWLFVARDAGSGTSSVSIWDGLAWHEITRAFASGRRIRFVKAQIVPNDRTRIWFDCGGDLLYFEMPLDKSNPINDSAFNYMHEGVMVSSIIDMGAASNLPKYIAELTAMSENLNSSGISVDLDYHVDSSCGKNDGMSDWIEAQPFMTSPEDTVDINAADIRKFQYRLRLNTNNSIIPPVVKGVVPNGYARSPYRTVISLRIMAGNIIAPNGELLKGPNELFEWLDKVSRNPVRVKMNSTYTILHDRYVIVGPPTVMPSQVQRPEHPWRGAIAITLVSLT